jgi:hypothetical protein
MRYLIQLGKRSIFHRIQIYLECWNFLLSSFYSGSFYQNFLNYCSKLNTNPLTPELNPSAQRCLPRVLLGILIFKGLTARRLYKSFGVKGLTLPIGSQLSAFAMLYYSMLNYFFDLSTTREIDVSFPIDGDT